MKQPPLPLTRELVLIGGGHAHALVLRRWGMRPLAGVRVTVINPNPTAPYTGMLPGYVAGHYGRDDLEIDLVQLARFAGVRLVAGWVTGIDREAQVVHVPGRPPIPYDVASINVGISSDLPALPGFAEHGVGAKPLGSYAADWAQFRRDVSAGTKPTQVAVLGGGVGGVELSLAMAHALQSDGHAPQITVIDKSEALPGLHARSRTVLEDAMSAHGVALIEEAAPARVEADRVVLEDGRDIPAAMVVGAAGARPQAWLAETGLTLDAGFVRVDETLCSSDPLIFAGGDCAALPDPRPKAGVYAVREAPVLYHNLRARLTGGQLRRYRPQKDYLKLISLGGKSALADKYGGRLRGPWLWRWKDHIDRKFMDKFHHLPQMPAPKLPREVAQGVAEALGDKPMCGGCGAKVTGAALAEALSGLPGADRDDVRRLPGDDAALLQVGGVDQVLSTDHLRALVGDPFVMARIAAVHALGDVWAMGARPQAALASVILPRLSERLQRDWLAEIMAGASEVFGAAGTEIVGGHSSMGDELTLGFSVTGLLDAPAITLAGAKPGDALILTKPIGSGTLMAAEMAGKAPGADVLAALTWMQQPQGAAAEILAGAHAMTDVTGFGLAGHLMNICDASGTGAELFLAAIPCMAGAEALAEASVHSTLYPANRALADRMELPWGPRAELLFDPQTAGGLLAAVASETAQERVERLLGAGYEAAWIGRITDGPAAISVR